MRAIHGCGAAGLALALAAAAVPASAHHRPDHAGGPPGSHALGGNLSGGNGVTYGPGGALLHLDNVTVGLVNDWFAANPSAFLRYSALPPGIARNLARGKALPPGIAMQALPPALAATLPPVPAGYGRFVVGEDLVLIELTSGLVSDLARILLP
ncbi:MAG: anti-virulence regulator CigR family protein [Alphaproteobacteria bacterium]